MWIDPSLANFLPEQRAANLRIGLGHPPPPQPAELLRAAEMRLQGETELKLRVLRPEKITGVMLDMHGGGFGFGSPAMADGINTYYARTCNVAVVGIDYRLAPANPHPAAVEDCLRAALWLIENAQQEFGTERLVIGGESSGATLATLTMLALRDRHNAAGKYCGAQLLVGNYDLSMSPSQRASTDALFLSPERLKETSSRAFPGRSPEQLRDPSISALYADLKGLPPAIFTVGTADAVLDDSMFMAARWQAAGNVAELHVYPEAPHLFMDYGTAMAAEGRRRVAKFLNRCIAGEFA